MAKPVAAYVIAPDDSGNTGKKVRTQSQSIGGQTVHSHFFVPVSDQTVEGIYYGDPGAPSTLVASAQNATSTGFWWLYNGSATINLIVRRVKIEHQIVATTVFITVQRVALARFTFTGSPAGTAVVAAKRATSDATPVGSMRTTQATAVVTLGAVIHSTVPATVPNTAPGANTASRIELYDIQKHGADQDASTTLVAGEGVVLFQPDAGTASETRRFDSDLVWEEVDAT